MKKIINNILKASVVLSTVLFTSCFSELDQSPEPQQNLGDESLLRNPESYKQFLGKLYGGLSLTNTAGGADVAGIDEGFSQYIRGYWKMQELTTDEAVIAWRDQTIQDFHNHAWTSTDVFITATYFRFDYQIKICNDFLRQTTQAKLESRGIPSSFFAQIEDYRNEARLLRAMSYYHALDMFGSFPIFTENSPTTYYLAEPATKLELFNFIETELKEIEDELKVPGANEYGRIDRVAAWMILSKLYLNSVQYIGSTKYEDALVYADKIVNNGYYALHDDYKELFMADNDQNGAQKEVIFPIVHDGIYTTSFGGTQFIIHAAVGGDMKAGDFGINGGWAGLRTTKSLVDKFSRADVRGMFFTTGQSLEIRDIGAFTDGYAITKFTNTKSDNQGPGSSLNFVDTDFPLFRLADAYLMYAEAHLRGGGGNSTVALDLVNQLRARAGLPNLSPSLFNLNTILDERARELYWEGHRRTDLIRFGKFTGGSYVWPWKGGASSGASTPSFRNVFPIPSIARSANGKLTQNPGY